MRLLISSKKCLVLTLLNQKSLVLPSEGKSVARVKEAWCPMVGPGKKPKRGDVTT